MEETKMSRGVHSLTLEERNRLMVTEVKDVGSFNEEGVHLNLLSGSLLVKGQGLHIQKLDPETSKVVVTGQVESLTYMEKKDGAGGGFLKRLLK